MIDKKTQADTKAFAEKLAKWTHDQGLPVDSVKVTIKIGEFTYDVEATYFEVGPEVFA